MFPGAGAAIQPASKSVATSLDKGTRFNPGPGRNDVTIDLEKLEQNFDTAAGPDPRVIPSRNGAASVSAVSKSICVITSPGFVCRPSWASGILFHSGSHKNTRVRAGGPKGGTVDISPPPSAARTADHRLLLAEPPAD